jgi:hypothetical protein
MSAWILKWSIWSHSLRWTPRFHSGSNVRRPHFLHSMTGAETPSIATISHSKAATCSIH